MQARTADDSDSPPQANEIISDNFEINLVPSVLHEGISLTTAAKVYFNAPEVVTAHLKNLDFGLKASIVYYELSASLFWVSVFESSVFYFSLVLWFTHIRRLASVWCHFLHLPRSLLGFYLISRMPNTHDLIQNINFGANEKIEIETLGQQVITAVTSQTNLLVSNNKKQFNLYILLSVLTAVLDIVGFFIGIAMFKSDELDY